MAYKISVDTGGTFTDVVISDKGGRLYLSKALTTPRRVFGGLNAALTDGARQIGLTVEQLLGRTSSFIYGTTRATNAVVERQTAKTALLTTKGFPDILVLKEGGKPNPHELDIDYPAPYIPRHLTFEVEERISSEGDVVIPLNECQLRRIADQLHARKVEAVAVCFLWSVNNPVHEERVGAILRESCPEMALTLSHRLNPVVREYRRCSAAAIDASLKPLMQRHLSEMEKDLRSVGYRGQILVSTSFGGVMHVSDVVERPIYLVRSGPAMAPIAGVTYARAERSSSDIIVCDTGGTTFDVSLIRDGNIKFTRDTWLGGEWVGHCTGLSSVDIRSIGAGGGSIAWIDSGGLLRVGPQSAGSDPGPACYGLGGTDATVTDAALVLGYLDPANFLGGRMRLDTDAAHKAVRSLSERLGTSTQEAANTILTIANEHMINAIREITVNEGLDPGESLIVAGGGAAGLNILPIARELGCKQVVLPRTAGALSACGGQFSDIVTEFTENCFTTSSSFDRRRVNATLKKLLDKARDFESSLTISPRSAGRVEYIVEARYLFQVWELEVPLTVNQFQTGADLDRLVEAFHTVHERVFAVRDAGQEIEFLNWKARLSVALDHPADQRISPRRRSPMAQQTRRAWFGEVEHEAPILNGEDLSAGIEIAGPALIVEPTTTVVVYPGMTARVSETGNYVVDTEVSVSARDMSVGRELTPMLMAVISNRLDGIVREMSSTLLRAARSAVINMGRDFSCAICTSDNELLSSAEGLPVHTFGMHLQTKAMCELHQDLAEGDAFLHNDPYLGNSHPADHTILVPVFIDGEHMFTACAKAHQADIGNSQPTTYFAAARDVYEEGSLIFPCVRVQHHGNDVPDVIRMCKARIRVPEQWYGDYLAAVGAARVGERRLKDLVAKYGKDLVRQFMSSWFDYSEIRAAKAIQKLPTSRLSREGRHDPMRPFLPSGIPIRVDIEIDGEAGRIVVDLRNNIDCVDCGLNQTEATSTNNAVNGIFNCLEPDIPHNSGSLRRIEVKLRKNCVVGIPEFPHSCSMATTNVAHWLVNLTQSAFAELGDGWGLAEGGGAMAIGLGVISGQDSRRSGARFVNQLILGVNGGPASARSDGWIMYGLPVVGGIMYRDSIEVDELKHPIYIRELRLVPDTGGAGRFRGAPGCQITLAPKDDPVTIVIPCDMQDNPPRGVRGGMPGGAAATWLKSPDGAETRLANFVTVRLEPGYELRGRDNGGGGYGNPRERDPLRVLEDVREGYVSPHAAADIYGVVVNADPLGLDWSINEPATTGSRSTTRSKLVA
jgi:N-methylhydantoinase A/oxoprolinase/acetone carboxylase beta subunit/N-methylhydantoinase B/oxoprolinase/acetone carboxylase alpha subunit